MLEKNLKYPLMKLEENDDRGLFSIYWILETFFFQMKYMVFINNRFPHTIKNILHKVLHKV